MDKYKENMMVGLLTTWFNNAEWEKPNFLHRNKIAVLIKKELQKVNRWKRPRKNIVKNKNGKEC